MTREQREAQLIALMKTQPGRESITKQYMKAAGIPAGQMPPVGMSGRQMIEVILDGEHPRPKPNE